MAEAEKMAEATIVHFNDQFKTEMLEKFEELRERIARVISGLLVGYQWVIRELSMGYQRVISRLLVGYQWVISGLSKG